MASRKVWGKKKISKITRETQEDITNGIVEEGRTPTSCRTPSFPSPHAQRDPSYAKDALPAALYPFAKNVVGFLPALDLVK